MIIVFANTKGGSGKTSLATSVLAQLAKDNAVLGVDLDVRKSAEKWGEGRTPEEGKFYFIEGAEDLKNQLNRVREQYHHIVVDTGGYDTDELRTALSLADVIILPLGVGSNDNIEGFREVSDIVMKLNAVRENKVQVFGVVVFAPSLHASAEFKRAIAEIKEDPNVQLLNSIIDSRVWYARAKDAGLGVTELIGETRSDIKLIESAQKEFMSFFNEIFEQGEL